jgi:nucleotide-binding universal stress UspA family protein
VALRIIREAKRPVIVFRPLDSGRAAPKRISTIALALDGGRFSERMIAYAVKAARTLSARLTLLQALPVHSNVAALGAHAQSDVLESAYLHRKAAEIKTNHEIEAQWEVLHGDPAEAICHYLHSAPETMLAMTTHARAGIERVVLGSVASACVRHAGVPLLLYWPHH